MNGDERIGPRRAARARRAFAFAALLLASVGGASAQSADAPAPPAARPGVRAVDDFLRRPRYADIRLSPDGKLLAAIVPLNDRRNLGLIDLEKRTSIALTGFTDMDVFSYDWVGDRVLEIKTADLSDEGGKVVQLNDLLLDAGGTYIRDMNKVSQRRSARIVAAIDRNGEHLIVQDNDRSQYSSDAYRYDFRTGEKKLLTFRTPGDVYEFIADRTGQVRIALSSPRGGTRKVISYRRSNDDDWTTLRDEPLDVAGIEPIGFGFDDKTLYVKVPSPEKGGLSDVYAFDPETNRLGERLLAANQTDGGSVVFDHVQRMPVGVTDGSRSGTHWIDPAWNDLQVGVDAALPTTRNQLGWGRYDTSRIVVTTQSETQPPIYYLLDRKTHKLEEVAAAYPWLKEADLSPRRFVRYVARDGLSIPAYLTLPRHGDGDKPPLIVDVHGGPFVPAARFGYDAEAQLFASRGYAVLQPDFRGTMGYGDAFFKAGWRQYGLAMQDDLVDGVRWLIATGQVDPQRVCLFGGSYGGYATLWGLERDPALFRCGVAFVAVADLELLFDVTWSDYMRSEWGGNATSALIRTVGDPARDREKLRAVSPLYHAEQIKAPLLLAYGGLDQRVPLIHGNRMRSALDRHGKDYEWVVYDQEAHGFTKEANRFDFYRRVDAFLARHLPATGTDAASSK